MKITLAVCYEIITPESAEHGDAEERGFEVDRRSYEFGDLKDIKRRYGPFYPLKHTGGDWWTSYSEIDYRTGAETTYTLHFQGLTPASIARIDRCLR